MDKMRTGTLIKEARIRKNYTQGELGDLLGVSNKAVSRWENGESFPDVSLLENLSMILDLSIHDIITGTNDRSDENALIEVVRTAKIQKNEKKRNIVKYILQILLVVCCLFSGISALGDRSFLRDYEYVFFMIISFALIIFISLIKKETRMVELNKVCKYLKSISLFTFCCSILLAIGIIVMIANEYVPFGIALSSVGQVANLTLILIFIMNLLVLAIQLFGYEKYGNSIYSGCAISVATIHLDTLYSNLFHKINLFQGVVEEFIIITIVVGISAGMSIVFISRTRQKENCKVIIK